MKNLLPYLILLLLTFTQMNCNTPNSEQDEDQTFTVHKIGEIIKENGKTFIIVDEKYIDAMIGMENFEEITVLYWFDKNDTPEQRSILQVHPKGNKENPMRGVFTTHAPVRPNLIAITRCKILSVKDNFIEIDDIDAYNHSPVIDLKS